ncbi:OPT oligopeptide transporter [Mycena indigotica]|uniref:OPT oligopeptide transporter n=1 Tax=Mycena indigotica TaxID=2126181 RepID=A0A8H6SVQ9_9AGAR|nr:OPT oligopeptide transporter [Mycena indigotica]KAF7307085.1 OPT oligopeptide transporter [Mycena indigotica]
MDAVQTLPSAGTPTSPSFDEKDEKGSKELDYVDTVPVDDVGEVFEDIRAIDMDAAGHEKPIVTASDWSTRLISLHDDPTLPVWTFRLWFLALGLSAFGAVLGEIFAFRPQAVYVSQLFLQVASFALGKILAEIIPGPGHRRYKMSNNAFWRFMNPGPFNMQENVGILIMAAASTHGALAINIFAADDLFYHFKPNPAIAIFTLLSSQLVGYGLAGMMRTFLVYPTYVVFPNLVPTIQMFDVLFRGQDSILQRKRVKFFWVLFIGICELCTNSERFSLTNPKSFGKYIAPTLTGISVFCLARQDSAWVTRIFGGAAGNEGLGLFSICLDWNYDDLGSGGSAYGALFQPLASQLSLFTGVLICIVSFIGAYATNGYLLSFLNIFRLISGYISTVWHAQNFPFISQLLFFENGTIYDQDLILNDDFTLNTQKLETVGLPWFSASYTIAKIGASLSFGATITHMLLFNGKQVWNAVKTGRKCDDPHYLKMKVYDEVPLSWYAGVFVASLAMGMATNYTGHSQLPWWGFFIAVGFAAFFLPIISTLYSILCYVPGTEDIARMLAAGLFPGKPIANMYFTLWAYNSTEQGRSMTRDLKMGQYTKLPPRVTFTMQCVGSIVGALINYVLMRIIVSSHRTILLSVQGTNTWSGAGIQSFNSDAIAWGALSKQLYSPSSTYGMVPLSIIIGLFVPLPFYILHRYYPNAHFDGVITPMICTQIGYLSGGINSSVFMTFLLCIFSQYYLRNYRPGFYRKYNFLISAALDGGTEVMTFVYSFAVGGAGGKTTVFPTWALNPVGNPDYCKRLT